jgi:putative endonuclease
MLLLYPDQTGAAKKYFANGVARFQIRANLPLYQNAGWSSLVARQAHNPAAAGPWIEILLFASGLNSMAWVYVVQNPDGRYYVGMTTDLDERVRDHNAGISVWTSHRGPWNLVWSLRCATIGEARKLENRLKRQSRGEGFFRLTGLRRS